MINDRLLCAFLAVTMEYVGQKTSNHFPMIIRGYMKDDRYGPAPFIFQNMWTNHSSFQDCVVEVW